MIIRLSVSDAFEMMRRMGRDYYSYEALEHIMNFYDEIDENTEFDPIAICGEWTEYEDLEELYNNYSSYIDVDENLDEDDDDRFNLDRLEAETYVYRLKNGHILIQAF